MSWLTDTLIATGGLIALVLALRAPVARFFGPRLAYALWLLPLLRLGLPTLVLPALPAAPAAPSLPVETVVTVLPDTTGPAATPAWSLAPVLQAVWLAGALAFLAWRAWGYATMKRRLLAGAIAVGEERGVRLVEGPAIAAPIAFGVFDRVVALPPGFMAMADRTARDLAIAHELEHHAGRDLLANILAQPLVALHWFNPLAHLGWRALRRDQEAACDARVLAGREPALREKYARLITSFARSDRPALAAALACPILRERSIIHRLRSLTMTEPTAARRLLGRLMIAAGVAALPLTASVTHAAQDAPQPPAPPAAPEAAAAPEVRVDKHVVMIRQPGKPGEGEHRVVVIEKSGGGDDANLQTRTISRGGHTYVFKTAQALSDAEVEARIAEVEKGMAEGNETMAMVAPPAPGQPHVRRMVVRVGGDGADPADLAKLEAEGAMVDCKDGQASKVASDQTVDGQRHVTRFVLCSKGGTKGIVAKALREARAEIAADTSMPATTKAEVLKKLDAEIEKAEKDSAEKG